jgi:hypothetical protein
LLIGPKLVGGYVPTEDQIKAIGGMFTLEARTKSAQSQLIGGLIHAAALKNDTTLLLVGGTWNYRATDVWALGLGGAFGYRWSTGNTYTQGAYTYTGKDSDALYAVILLTPMLLTFDPWQVELTGFIGRDIATPSNGVPASTQPGGYIGVAYLFDTARR